jgi:FkbM family methyltransferase
MYASPELDVAVRRLAGGKISVFSFEGCERYDAMPVEIFFDEDGFPWVRHDGKRLYFRHGMSTDQIVRTYRRLRTEQDPASPHYYGARGFEPRPGDVLLDIGAAEGIWALEGVEHAGHVALFEVDPAWIGALERTFAPWADKVSIVNKFASDGDRDGEITVDTVAAAIHAAHTIATDSDPGDGTDTNPPPALLMKLDVEGAEARVLAGAKGVLEQAGTRAIVCTYHRHDDFLSLSAAMNRHGFDVTASPGWMLFVHDRNLRAPFFRRGVIYCKKNRHTPHTPAPRE